MFYETLGWDKATGAPTREVYDQLGLARVGEEMAAKGLVPGNGSKT